MEHTEFANDIARRFGLLDAQGNRLVFEAAQSEHQRSDVRARLRSALDGARPIATALSVGEALTGLLVAAGAEGPSRGTPRGNVRKQLAELDAIVQSAAFGRAKRAERARLLAELLVIFDLPAALGFETSEDHELAIRLARRAVERLLAR